MTTLRQYIAALIDEETAGLGGPVGPTGPQGIQLASETAGTNVTLKAGSFFKWRVIG